MQRSFCLCTQIYMMKMQHQAHTAVQENNCLQLHVLQQFLPLYFNFNMHSYARLCPLCWGIIANRNFASWPERHSKLKRFIYTSPRPLPSLNSSRPKGGTNCQPWWENWWCQERCLFVIICIEMVFKYVTIFFIKIFEVIWCKCVCFDSIILVEAFSYSSNI